MTTQPSRGATAGSDVRDPVTGANITDEALRCRTYGHAWDEVPASMVSLTKRMVGGFQLHLRCTRCTTLRHDVYNLVGHLAARYYEYPEGYQHAVGSEKFSRDQYRLMLIQARTKRAGRRVARRRGA